MKAQRQKISSSSTAALLFPTDLIIEILSRLPSKSIARCRCVSKFWKSIIRSPHFTDLVLTKTATTRPQLLFACENNGEVFFFTSPQPKNPDENSSPITVDYHMCVSLDNVFDNVDVSVLPPVNGLVCSKHTRISKSRKDTVLVVCNPSTGESLTLPRVKTRRVDVMSFFGYDPIDKQFKLLSMTRSRYGSNKFSEEHQVITLGISGKLSWRMIKCSILPHCPLAEGICIDGVLYYPARVKGFESKFRIACFDIKSEKFKLIEEDDKAVRGKLVNYNGKLAVLRSDNWCGVVCERSKSFELCVLENAEKHEWSTHSYVLPPMSTDSRDIVSRYGMYIKGITRTGEIVLSPYNLFDPFYLLYYNLETKTIRKVEIQGIDDVFVTVILYLQKINTFIDHVEDVKLGGVFKTS